MNLENEIFKKSIVIFNKLEKYGFKKVNNCYVYRTLLNEDFTAEIVIDINGKVTGKVIDIEFNDEYTNFRIDNEGAFSNNVRKLYMDVLSDIKSNCFKEKLFVFENSNRITNYIFNKYKDKPEFLWDKLPNCAVFRNKNNKKWYGIIMTIDKSKLFNSNGEVEIINVKTDENRIGELINKNGFYKAYHMNKRNWITIILDGTVAIETIIELVDESYKIVNKI